MVPDSKIGSKKLLNNNPIDLHLMVKNLQLIEADFDLTSKEKLALTKKERK